MEGDFSFLPDLRDANRKLIRDFSTQLGAALGIIAEPDNLPLVFHCIGGKDRTGMAAALLLTLLGVPWPTVKADYMKTNGRLGRGGPDVDSFIDRLVAERNWDSIPEEGRRALRRFFVLEEEYIEAAWDEIEQVAGSFCGYVHRYLGLTDRQIEVMRSELLERHQG